MVICWRPVLIQIGGSYLRADRSRARYSFINSTICVMDYVCRIHYDAYLFHDDAQFG